ncbi:MAG: Glu-tRNA(Gln) amidotransferase subunit GatD [archaeon]|nr:Glu-tRNA(Gln) amidotransferase subunit GatD [archaeon]
MSYSIDLSKRLEEFGIVENSKISVEKNGMTYIGTIVPHPDLSSPDVIILKLANGYNIGIRINKDSKIKVIDKPLSVSRKVKTVIKENKNLPTLALISTGGTIASYIDYRTGAVHPTLSASDMINFVPEINEIANVRTKVLFSVLSENMNISHWQEIAKAVAEEINNGADGIIVSHGTDTMGYTAAALSFMLGNVPKPVVLVGSQRSSDRPSSDAPANLIACAQFCVKSGKSGVYVVMHDTLGDDSFAVHIGSRVRKMHTSRRDAFKSINIKPAANIDKCGNIIFNMDLPPVSKSRAIAKTNMETSTVLLQYYPGMDPSVFREVFMKSKGVVIAGSGLGHVSDTMAPLVGEAIKNGTVVIMTSQCINGQTNMNVYNTGRDLASAGIVSVFDILPETAYVKLSWVLANHSRNKVIEVMKTPLCREFSNRRIF